MADDQSDHSVSETLQGIGQRLLAEGRVRAEAPRRTALLLQELGIEASPTLLREGAPPATGPEGQSDFGRYRVLGEIGRGATGLVLEAEDTELRRTVAIKVLLDHREGVEEIVERFVAEAQVTAQLEHPGIIPIHDIGITPDGRLFMVMKRVHGRSLLEVLSALAHRDAETTRVWTLHHRLTTFVQICRAVGYAHDRGVVHRDLKPSNLMVGAFGEVLVMDWGIARVLAEAAQPISRFVSHHTAPGRAIGTVGYMSPEQMLGAHAQLKPTSDVWSLGVILYELLSVRRAFMGKFAEVSDRVTRGPVSVEGISPQLMPPELAAVITRATSVQLSARFQSAGELAQAVDGFLEKRTG